LSPKVRLLFWRGRYFRYNLRQTPVEVTISEPRQVNVLEEFVLRTVIELESPPTEEEIASLLGIDSIFVRNTTATLRSLNTLEVTPESTILVTPSGQNLFNAQNFVLQPHSTQQLYAIADPLSGKVTFQSCPLVDAPLDLDNLGDFITLDNNLGDISSLEIEEIQQIVQESDLAIHVPNVTKCQELPSPRTVRRKISIIVLFDDILDKLLLKVYSGEQELESASNRLNELKKEGELAWENLFGLSDEFIAQEREAILQNRNLEVDARINNIRQMVRENAVNNTLTVSTSEAISIQLLRGSQIYPAFIETLNQASQQIIIYSPWVSASVVNDQFIQHLQILANRGVWILIGHGIARSEAEEERRIPLEVNTRLRAIRTNEGIPAVQVIWLGSSHAKEVIVDRRVHLCGSNNYLSCRAGRLWDEVAYKVEIPHLVEEAHAFLAQRFESYAENLWNNAVQNRDYQLAETAVCMWGALGMEIEAFRQLQHNSWTELIPLWLKVVCQRLRSQNVSDNLASLETALSLLRDIESGNLNI
jgi:hypothetical protein